MRTHNEKSTLAVAIACFAIACADPAGPSARVGKLAAPSAALNPIPGYPFPSTNFLPQADPNDGDGWVRLCKVSNVAGTFNFDVAVNGAVDGINDVAITVAAGQVNTRVCHPAPLHNSDLESGSVDIVNIVEADPGVNTTVTIDIDQHFVAGVVYHANALLDEFNVSPRTARAFINDDLEKVVVFTNAFTPPQTGGAVLLIIDEDGIDNGLHFNKSGGFITPSGPNFFTSSGVNDNNSSEKQRGVLPFFANNIGLTITVRTGKTDDEGWFAPNCIPFKFLPQFSKENNTCLTNGNRDLAIDNFFGLNGSSAIPPQERLDKIPHLIPLRSLGLVNLIGKTVCAVVYDSDISINYDHDKPDMGVNGKLQGETYGIVAFDVNAVNTLNGFSSSTLPQVQITIRDPAVVCGTWVLFRAPVPQSSSVPNDRLVPPSTAGYKVPNQPPVFF